MKRSLARRSAGSRPRRAGLPRAPCRSCACAGRRAGPVGWNCTISMSRSGSPARSAIARPSQLLSPEGVWYLYIVGPPPVASSTALRAARTRTRPCACRSSARRRSRRRRCALISSTARCSSRRAMLARPHLLGEPVDDLDAGEVALVHGAVEGLAGERLLVDACRRDCGRRSSRARSPARGCARPPASPASTRGPGRAATCRPRSCP